MPSLNKVTLIGHLGRDPEIRYTQDQKPIATFSIATSEKYKDKETTEWHNIVAFGKLAEICQKYLTKGAPVYVEGRIQSREYDGRDGNKRKVYEIIASHMVMLGGKRQEAPRDDREAIMGTPLPDAGISDHDIPF